MRRSRRLLVSADFMGSSPATPAIVRRKFTIRNETLSTSALNLMMISPSLLTYSRNEMIGANNPSPFNHPHFRSDQKVLSRGEQNRRSFVVSKTGNSRDRFEFTRPSFMKSHFSRALALARSNTQRVGAPSDSRKRASGGDEFSSLNSRRRRSLRVMDSPCLRE